MDPAGTAALLVVVLAGLGAWTLRGPSTRWQPHLVALTVAGWWAAVVGLAVRFAAVDLRLAEVVALSRDEVPLPLRLAGVWAGPAGSALCWFAVVATVVALAAPRARRLVGAVSALVAPVVLVLAGPFDLVDQPVISGRGLSPVLEHPMMTVHPPLLYLAQALVLAAALAPPGRSARRLGAAAVAGMTTATLLGAWWAHDELGWGGWWAWDPVENTALAPLVALLAALHATGARGDAAWRRVAAVAVLAGIALTRSGLPSSVHAFSSGAAVAVTFALGAVVAAVVSPRGLPPRTHRDHPVDRRVAAGLWNLGAGWTVTVIAAGGLAAAVLGSREPPAAIDGRLLARLLAPVGLALVVGLLGWGFRRGRRPAALVAHVGAVLFGVGVIGSLASSSTVATLRVGEPERVAGSTVEITRTRVTTERADLVRLAVDATVDGRRLTAAILDHPDLGRTRARPGRLVDPGGETELVVATVRDDNVRVELRRHPGLPYVWIGGALVALGALGGAQSRRRRRRASSTDSSVEPSSPAERGAGSSS